MGEGVTTKNTIKESVQEFHEKNQNTINTDVNILRESLEISSGKPSGH